MKIRHLLLLLAVLSFACTQDEKDGGGNGNGENVIGIDDDVMPGMIRIKLREDVADLQFGISSRGVVESGVENLDALAARYGAVKAERLFADGGKFRERRRAFGLHRWYTLYFDESQPVSRATADYAALPEIEYAIPVDLVKPYTSTLVSPFFQPVQGRADGDYPFNDPELSKQWHYWNDGSIERSKAGADINLFDAWKLTGGSRDIVVAIIDGGIDYQHEDIAANMWVNEGELNGAPNKDNDGNGYNNDVYGFNFFNDHGGVFATDHGTHVAGTVSAVNNNGIGVSGVAGGTGNNDGVRLMSCQIFDNSTTSQRLYPDAFVYAADNGAHIAQCSWGSAGQSTDMSEAIAYFIQNAGLDENGNQVGPMKGGVAIFAAGNETSSSRVYPAAAENVIAVASLGSENIRASYTNYGAWIDISAHGGDGGLPYSRVNAVYSTMPSNSYGYLQGTSMACPHVSGVAALIIAKYGGPGFTAAECQKMLLENTRDVDEWNANSFKGRLGVGMLDATAALIPREAGKQPEELVPVTVWDDNAISVTWKIVADQNGNPVVDYRLFISPNPLDNLDPDNHLLPVVKHIVSHRGAVGDEITYVIPDLLAATTYTIALYAKDIYRRYSEPFRATGKTGQGQIGQYTPVKVKDLENQTVSIGTPATIDLSEYFLVADPVDPTITYGAVSTDTNIIVPTVEGTILTLTPVATGMADITVIATSATNGRASETFTVTVQQGNGGGGTPTGNISIYPNPVTTVLNVRFPEVLSVPPTFMVYNSAGRKVYDQEIISTSTEYTLDLSSLSGGSYTLVVDTGNKKHKQNFVKK